MRISHEDLKDLFKRFRWIDNIPEDQEKRDEICMKAKAALLLEANMNSEMFPAFLRGEKGCYVHFFKSLRIGFSPAHRNRAKWIILL